MAKFGQTPCPCAIIHEGDAEAVVKEKQEKALAEHVARHPEDAGRTVQDFNWIVREIIRSYRGHREGDETARLPN